MFKSKIALFFISTMMLGTPLFAQIPDSQPAQVKEVSDADLRKFAQAYQEIQAENQKAQGEMRTAIEKEGLDPQRYNEIQQIVQNPDSTVDVPKEEMAKHEKASEELNKIQSKFQTKMEATINKNGLTMVRFNEVFASIQNNPALQQKVQNILAENQ